MDISGLKQMLGRRAALAALLLAGVGFSVAGWWLGQRDEDARIRAEFVRRTAVRHALTRAALRANESAVFTLRTLLLGPDPVTPERFGLAAREVLARYPGFVALEWVPLVPQAGRRAFEAEASRVLGAPVVIRDRALENQVVPAGERSEYLPILYVEPTARNERAVGVDVRTSDHRADLERARATGQPTLSGQTHLVQDRTRGGAAAFILLWPVYEPGPAPQKFLGVVQGVFRMDTLIGQSNDRDRARMADALYLDLSATGTEPRVLGYRSADGATRDAPAEEFFRRQAWLEQSLSIGGREWSVLYRPAGDWIAAQRTDLPRVCLLSGLTVTALLGVLWSFFGRRRRFIARQVAERTQQLRDSQRQLALVLSQLPGMVYQLAPPPGLQPAFVSEGALALTGYAPADLLGAETFAGLLDPADRERRARAIAVAMDERRDFECEYRLRHRDGRPRWVLDRGRGVYDRQTLRAVEGIVIDLTDRRLAETALDDHCRRLDQLLRALPGMAYRCAHDERLSVVYLSEGGQALTGFVPDDFYAGRVHLSDLIHPDDVARVQQETRDALAQHRSFELEYRIRDRAGATKWILSRGQGVFAPDGAPLFFDGFAIDITSQHAEENRKLALQRGLLERETLDRLGLLAAGVARDFHPTLGSIADLVRRQREQALAASSLHADLREIELAAARGTDLCRHLLAYAGQAEFASARLALAPLITGLAALPAVGAGASLQLELAPGVPDVLADAAQIREALTQLVLHALDSLSNQRGNVTLGLGLRYIERVTLQTAVTGADLPEGHYVAVHVSDTGRGIPPANPAALFDPYFTTKPGAPGLGLAVVLGTVRRHRGALLVTSAPGQGTTFTLLLPPA